MSKNITVEVSLDTESIRQWCAILVGFNLDKDRLLRDTQRLARAGYRGEHLNQLLVAAYSAEETGMATADTLLKQFVSIAK